MFEVAPDGRGADAVAEFEQLNPTGTPIGDPVVQAIIARHHAWVRHFWTPGREAYIGLGQLYSDDERFTTPCNDAIAVYAEGRLPEG